MPRVLMLLGASLISGLVISTLGMDWAVRLLVGLGGCLGLVWFISLRNGARAAQPLKLDAAGDGVFTPDTGFDERAPSESSDTRLPPTSAHSFETDPSLERQRQSRPQVREGEILGEKYRTERVLGVGRGCVVVAAHHLNRDEKVAVKLWARDVVGEDDNAVARFRKAGRVVSRLNGEHVARVTDADVLPDGTPYREMEALDGADLSVYLKEQGPLPIAQAVEFVRQACLGVAEAETLGIVHRHLEPTNLFCVRSSAGTLSIKVLDFGLPGESDVRYQSPERITGGSRGDAATHVWALGVILLELLTGRTPFESDTVPKIVLKVVAEPAPLLRALRRDAPAALEAVIARCLEKDGKKRYASSTELARSLTPFVSGVAAPN